jgi:simple sugar transport system permease protein
VSAYSVLLNRTRFGFDLRATGRSESAAVASGVNVKRYGRDLDAPLRRGRRAGRDAGAARRGLLLQPGVPGRARVHRNRDRPAGRNHPVGIAIGALLWAYLEVSANPLQILVGVSSEIVTIMQGVIVLSVVVAYELVRRFSIAQEQRRVARELDAVEPPPREPQEVTI